MLNQIGILNLLIKGKMRIMGGRNETKNRRIIIGRVTIEIGIGRIRKEKYTEIGETRIETMIGTFLHMIEPMVKY